MKKKTLFGLLLVLFCLFSMPVVHADLRQCDPFDKSDAEKNLTGAKLHYENKKAYTPGEKVYIDLTGVERGNDIDIAVLLRTTDTSTRKYYTLYLKNILGNESTGAYFILPDDQEHFPTKEEWEIYGYGFYKKTNEIRDYGITPDGQRVPMYKELCTNYYTNQADVDERGGYLLANSTAKFVLNEKKPEVENILKEIKVEKDYTYFGGKIKFTVSTTQPVKNAYLTFTDRTKSTFAFFTVNLISDGKSNEFSYTVDAPTYGINNVVEGTYKLEEIQFYDANNKKYTYNTNQEKAEEYNDKYVDYNLTVFLGKPITDLLKESKFELKETKLIKNEAKVGEKVTVSFDYYYNTPNLRIQSVMLSFQDETNNTTLNTYLKEVKKDSSIIVPSTAKAGEYTLKTVTITFDSYVGETNTIILNKETIGDSYKSIFDQKLKITDNEEAGLYFIAEELYQTSYEKIKAAKENTVVTINANNKSVIPAELFDAIKESAKQLVIEYEKNEWVFSGVDVENSKPVDVSMKFYNASELESEEAIKKVIGDKAVVLEFPSNGDLPGKALIRIKDSEVFDKLEGNVYYIYHIDETTNKLNKVAIELQKSSDGYLEFYINHNSKYVITNEEVKASDVVGQDDAIAKVNAVTDTAKKEEKTSSDNTMLYVIIGACVVVILLLLVIIAKKPKKGKEEKKVEAVEEPKAEEPKTEEAPEEKKE